jgi:hypothetical protein
MTAAEQPRMRLIGWKSLVKGPLRGFATVEIELGTRVKLHDIAVFIGSKGPWTSQSKVQIDNGRVKTDAAGKTLYSPVVEWCDAAFARRFSSGLVELVRRKHPGALDEEGSPARTLS